MPFGASKGVVAHAIRMPHDTEIRSLGIGEKKNKEWTKTGLFFKLRRDRTFEILMVYEGKKGQGREQHP